jgi:hypothetical protein
VAVTLETSVSAVLYTVLLITGIEAAQCFVLTFYRFDTLPFGTEQTKQLQVSEFVLRGITSFKSLATSLKRTRKEMNLLLHKVAVVDTLLGTRNYILESNVK